MNLGEVCTSCNSAYLSSRSNVCGGETSSLPRNVYCFSARICTFVFRTVLKSLPFLLLAYTDNLLLSMHNFAYYAIEYVGVNVYLKIQKTNSIYNTDVRALLSRFITEQPTKTLS